MIPLKKSKVDEAKVMVKPSKFDKSKKKEEAARKKAEAEKKAAMMEAKGPAKKAPAKKAVVVNDDVMDGDDGEEMKGPAPAAKKPPNIGKKPEPKKDGDAPAEKKGPPALSSSKPAASGGGSSGPAKPMTPEMVVEEDLGPGMSKETALNKA